MQKQTGSRFQRLGLVLPVIALGVIIIALVGVASRGPKTPAAPPSPSTADAGPASNVGQIVWYDAPRPGPTATTFLDASGTEHTLADFAGKALVVNFWATWCAPCVKEMPTLDALQDKLGGGNFAVLAISQDREGAQVAKPFIEKKGWQHLALYTEAAGHFAHDAKLNGLPTSIIIDKSGQEIGRVEGELNWVAPEVEKKLEELAGAAH